MGMLNEKVVAQTREVLKELRDPVRITYFSQEMECEPCAAATSFLEEFTALDERLVLEKKDFLRDKELAAEMGVHHIPAFTLLRPGGGPPALTYYGVPAGYEYGAFLRVLVLFSTGSAEGKIAPALLEGLERAVNLKVFVLATCPSCPVMAYQSAAFAFLSPRVRAEIIDANGFADLSHRFSVGAVPKIVLNDTVELTGVYPPEELAGKMKAL